MRWAVALAVAACLVGCTPEQPERDPVAVPTDAVTAAPSPSASAALPLLTGAFAPKDECAAQPGWAAFADQLRAAIKARDAKAVAALADPAIKLDFGGGTGRDELIARLNGTTKFEPLWPQLEALGSLGCAFDKDGNRATMPWFFQQDIAPHDPFEVLLTVGPDQMLLTGPDPKSAPVARLSWVLVKPVGSSDWEARYQRVSVIDHVETGYVATKALRSQIDYRLLATRGPQGWQIDALIAGD